MLQIVNPTVPKSQPERPLLVELRTSMEASGVTWALAQADCALNGRPMPAKITDLHHAERRKYEDAALMALLLVNRDAELFAERQATNVAFETFEQFCKDHGLDWLDDSNPANTDDGLEVLISRIASKAVQRFRQTLSGTYPGLSNYLAKLAAEREMCWSCGQYPAPRPGAQCNQCWKENQ